MWFVREGRVAFPFIVNIPFNILCFFFQSANEHLSFTAAVHSNRQDGANVKWKGPGGMTDAVSAVSSG